MKALYASIHQGLLLASGLLFVIGYFFHAAMATQWYLAGYSLLTVALLFLLIFYTTLHLGGGGSSNNCNNFGGVRSMWSTAVWVLTALGPFVLLLASTGLMTYIMSVYRQQVDRSEQIGYSYSFTNLNVTMVLLQLYVLSTNALSPSGQLSPVPAGFMFLFSAVELMCAVQLLQQMTYFSTEGWSAMNL